MMGVSAIETALRLPHPAKEILESKQIFSNGDNFCLTPWTMQIQDQIENMICLVPMLNKYLQQENCFFTRNFVSVLTVLLSFFSRVTSRSVSDNFEHIFS